MKHTQDLVTDLMRGLIGTHSKADIKEFVRQHIKECYGTKARHRYTGAQLGYVKRIGNWVLDKVSNMKGRYVEIHFDGEYFVTSVYTIPTKKRINKHHVIKDMDLDYADINLLRKLCL